LTLLSEEKTWYGGVYGLNAYEYLNRIDNYTARVEMRMLLYNPITDYFTPLMISLT